MFRTLISSNASSRFLILTCSTICLIVFSNPSFAIYDGAPSTELSPALTNTVAILDEYGQILCSGSLISKTLVLTAAHCVEIKNRPIIYFTSPHESIREPKKFNSNKMRIAQAIYRTSQRIQDVPENVYKSPTFQRVVGSNDLAIIRITGIPPVRNGLSGQFQFKPIEILSLKYDYDLSSSSNLIQGALAAGYGYNEIGIWGDLKEANVRINGILETNDRNSYIKVEKYDGQICMGDSGGPIYTMYEGKWYILGVSSHRIIESEDPLVQELEAHNSPAFAYCQLPESFAVNLSRYRNFTKDILGK